MSIETEDPGRLALEQRADHLRSRLANTLAALERRRRELMSDPTRKIKEEVRLHASQLMWVGAGFAVMAGAAVVAAALRARYHRKHRARERVHALARVWNHPERIGRGEKPTFFSHVLRTVIGSALSTLASQAIKIGARRTALPEGSH